jgi:hypothetical protein
MENSLTKVWRLVFSLLISFSSLALPLSMDEMGKGQTYRCEMTEGWMRLAPTLAKFSVHLPKAPDFNSTNLSVGSRTLIYQEYVSTPLEDVHYVVGVIELPKRWKLAGSKTLLNKALDLAVKEVPDVQLISKNMVKHGPYSALDFHLKMGEVEKKGRLILVGATLYRLSVSLPSEKMEGADLHPFIDSFTVS